MNPNPGKDSLGVLVCLEGVAWMGLCIVEDNGEDVISGVPVP